MSAAKSTQVLHSLIGAVSVSLIVDLSRIRVVEFHLDVVDVHSIVMGPSLSRLASPPAFNHTPSDFAY